MAHTARPAHASPFRVPLSIDFAGHPARIRWQPSDGARFTEPFFDDTLARLRRRGGGRPVVETTPVDTWAGVAPGPDPAAFILHVSRCGSTLLSRMLGALPDTLVVSEARVFDDILRGRRGDPAIEDAVRDTWLRHALAAFAASQAVPPARVVVKLDCWHLFEIGRLRRAFPDTPLLFVYRDPLEVLVSLMARPSLTLVRDTVAPEEIGITRTARDALTREELAAAIMGAFFRQAARHREHLAPVPYAALPDAAWTGIPAWRFTAREVEALRRAAEADAKQPDRPFVPDSGAKRAAATAEIRAACAAWSEPAYATWLAAT
jgi:hypothetical protein